MNLKIKKFDWLAGRPVAILNYNTAKKLNVRPDERISFNGKKIYAVVDIFDGLVSDNEVGLSLELSNWINKKSGEEVEVHTASLHNAALIINKKISGHELNKEEINILISEIVQNNLTESEIAYLLSAEKFVGMSTNEIINLTKAMVSNGERIIFNKKIIADKHCIGGIAGNRTTPIVVAICSAVGLTIPKTSSKAITSASGTADVIETISKVDFSAEELKKIVKKAGACLVWGGGLGLAPSDDKIIHIERIINIDVEPQLLASIMSKKVSAGSNHVLIDIPYGKEAKVKSLKEAKILGSKFLKIANAFKMKIKLVFTNGEDPIGRGVGPVLEMLDVISVLKNELNAPIDLRDKSIYLASELLSLCGYKNSKKIAEEILKSGKAYKKFRQIINTQNSQEPDSSDFDDRILKLKTSDYKKEILAEKSGKIINIDNKQINNIARVLGCPESKSSGIFLNKQRGLVKNKEVIMTLYSESESRIKDALSLIESDHPFRIN